MSRAAAGRLAEAAAGRRRLTRPERRRLARFRTQHRAHAPGPIIREPTHFHYPGLRRARIPRSASAFPGWPRSRRRPPAILEDFQRVMAAERAELVPYIQYPDDVPLRQWADAQPQPGLDRDPPRPERRRDRGQCPPLPGDDGAARRARPAGRSPARSPNAMFSLLAPGAHIPPHNGVANTRLVCHLPLIVPRRLLVPGRRRDARDWEVGKAWVFDDTIEHEALNPSDALRVILIVDTWHPGSVRGRARGGGGDDGGDRSGRRGGGAVSDADRRRAGCAGRRSRRDADAVFRAGADGGRRQGLAERGAAAARARRARSHPHDARMWQVLGLAHRKLDELAAAVAALDKAAALAPRRRR